MIPFFLYAFIHTHAHTPSYARGPACLRSLTLSFDFSLRPAPFPVQLDALAPRQLTNLSKLLAHLFAGNVLSLAMLKVGLHRDVGRLSAARNLAAWSSTGVSAKPMMHGHLLVHAGRLPVIVRGMESTFFTCIAA